MKLNLDDFNYNLPDELIANQPPKERGSSGLLILNRQEQTIEKSVYSQITGYLSAGDLLVINDTKVIKARLMTRKQSTGVEREIIVLENHGRDDDWFEHFIIHRGKVATGDILLVDNHQIEILETFINGTARIKSTTNLLELCDQFGTSPLPPYMKRQATASDVERYQTIFAEHDGSVAAPTASLNMTDEILDKLRQKGVEIAKLTLHVGLGTFLPIRVDDVTKHQMHQEYFEIPKETIAKIYDAKRQNHRVIALGTTVTRCLEYSTESIIKIGQQMADQPELVDKKPLTGEANTFIYPGYQFKLVDALITNFHAPKSTVLMMAAAFAGWDFLHQAYDFAIDEKMRFLSYGDSMLII